MKFGALRRSRMPRMNQQVQSPVSRINHGFGAYVDSFDGQTLVRADGIRPDLSAHDSKNSDNSVSRLSRPHNTTGEPLRV
jgi:hypothetical protein